ncbi:TIGR03936 family radical SAM-associated protein [Oscillospiraceae bacterium PP1C4]
MPNAVYSSTVRVFFKKQGRIKYISHLDINRCVARALKRSGLPVWHTLGFNPHIYTTFALPLSLGYESECESMDFRLTEELPMQEVVDRLNAVFPEGLIAYAAQPAGAKPEAICWADYEITQEFDGIDAQTVVDKFAAYCAQEEIPVVKKTKKGDKTIDVKPCFSVRDVKAEGCTLSMTMRAAAGITLNINPTLILDAFAENAGIKADWMRVVRIAILDQEFKAFA